jgi:tRNA/tmRNA/rRNA uracil-C5-methylase (TrmA/RlmC/RlmD family)
MVLRTLLPAGLPLAFTQVSGAILTLVLKCRPDEAWRTWARSTEGALRAAGVESLQLNWNPAAGRRALSSRHQEVVFGPELVFDGELAHGAQSFRQQIPELENDALDLAEAFLAEAGLALAVDLYSGTGASLRRWLARGWETFGVELVGEACRAAAINAPGARVLKGKVELRLPQLEELVAERAFVLYTNPPRDGHAAPALAWITNARPARIAYLSCNPRSLARDLAALAPLYRVTAAQPFDFFPQTDHVETLALLERR